jgi:predicted nucleic acid-binding protein
VITLDTSGLLALLWRQDPDHDACRRVIEEDGGPFIIPAAILSEVGWFLEQRLPSRVERAFLGDIRDGAYAVDWTHTDVIRVLQLTEKYDDLPLGLANAAVVACAERYRGRVLTVDRRYFSVVARGEKSITPLPE